MPAWLSSGESFLSGFAEGCILPMSEEEGEGEREGEGEGRREGGREEEGGEGREGEGEKQALWCLFF